MKILLLIPFLIALFGCSSFDKAKCNNKKLHSTGAEDAKAGKANTGFMKFAQKCQEQGITIETATYTKGFNEGLKEFCTNKSAFNYGMSGKTNNGICPNSDKFAKYFDKGNAIYKVKTDIDGKGKSIIELQKKMNMIKTTAVEKKDLEKQVKDLKRVKNELEAKLTLLSRKNP